MTREKDNGMALVAVLLILTLGAAIAAGFAAIVMNENRQELTDRDRTQAFYAAHAGLEKATTDLGTMFATNYAPTGAQVNALDYTPPSISGVTFVTTSEGPGYDISFTPDGSGNPAATTRTITAGPYQGFTGLVTPYNIKVTASTPGGGEVRLQRTLETVSIPVFQFGIFSETDLSYFPGPNFDFGGRVHTNANLYLATGATLSLSDRVTAVGEVIRTNLSNGWPTSDGYTGTVRAITTPGTYRNLSMSEGSLVGTLGTSRNEPTWTNLSTGTYNGNLRNGRTGGRRLDLPLITIGSSAIELIRRPATGETTATPVYALRAFGMASLRILLSDTSANITNLPSVTATAPVQLGAATPAWYLVGGLCTAIKPCFAQSKTEAAILTPAGAVTANMTAAGSPLLGGFIKIEKQDNTNAWTDVTQEIMNLGIAGANMGVANCTDPSPNAVIRLQRVRDNPSITVPNSCGGVVLAANDYWPMALYDPREGGLRDNEPTAQTTVRLGGVMYYVELDMNNLRRWFAGTIGTTGTTALNNLGTGYVVYFSDRRTNQNAAGNETGEYGNEDVVNPASANGTPNGVLDAGEDINGSGALDVYGRTAEVPAGVRTVGVNPAFSTYTPETLVDIRLAKVNPPLFYRRALKLVNGTAGNLPTPGVTIVTENPVYVEGNFNANGNFTGAHAAAAIIADAVTLLSNQWTVNTAANWGDNNPFANPENPTNRDANDSWYRVAIIAGKGMSFPQPTVGGVSQDFGTDGGVHNFLRYIESWGGATLHYRGSMGSFYYSRQAVGTFKCCTNVYGAPTRDYQFDVDFLTPTLLPPKTPMFRDINTLGFTQMFTIPQ